MGAGGLRQGAGHTMQARHGSGAAALAAMSRFGLGGGGGSHHLKRRISLTTWRVYGMWLSCSGVMGVSRLGRSAFCSARTCSNVVAIHIPVTDLTLPAVPEPLAEAGPSLKAFLGPPNLGEHVGVVGQERQRPHERRRGGVLRTTATMCTPHRREGLKASVTRESSLQPPARAGCRGVGCTCAGPRAAPGPQNAERKPAVRACDANRKSIMASAILASEL